VRDRSPEESDHRVADELLHRAAEALQLPAQALVVGRKQRANVLRIHLLRPRRETDEVGEEDGDDLALLARRGWLQDGPAREAEPRARGVLLPALWTDQHPSSVGGCRGWF
jgi:MoxR-like ATPase